MNLRFPIAVAIVLTALPTQAAVRISSKPTRNMSCAAGICTPTAKKANLNATDLANMLANGDATVKSTSQANDIEIDAALSWISASRLTLDSYSTISFDKFISVKGSGALTLTTNDGGTGGDLDFEGAGRVAFWDMSSSLIINRTAYTLESGFAALTKAVTANPSGNFALANNDKVHGKPFRTSPIDVTFNGTLEGLGNAILDLSLEPRRAYVAMITEIGSTGTVRDLSLVNLSIVTSDRGLDAVGGLVALSIGFIDGVHVNGAINSSYSYDVVFGPLAALDFGSITKSSASGTITVVGTNSTAGGLVGVNEADSGQGFISWSHASVDITGASLSGGLAGQGGNLDNCYATGNVTGDFVGGLVGQLYGTIADSFATGNVYGHAGAGGLLGSSVYSTNIVRHVYATGSVASDGTNESSGGLAVVKDGGIDQAYAIGAVTTAGSKPPGGLLADDDGGTISTSVWDMDTSGITDPAQGAGNIANDPGITGLSDSALKSGLPSGFDPAVWGQNPSINNGYPYLLANPPPQ
jgi:hypothetical protein